MIGVPSIASRFCTHSFFSVSPHQRHYGRAEVVWSVLFPLGENTNSGIVRIFSWMLAANKSFRRLVEIVENLYMRKLLDAIQTLGGQVVNKFYNGFYRCPMVINWLGSVVGNKAYCCYLEWYHHSVSRVRQVIFPPPSRARR